MFDFCKDCNFLGTNYWILRTQSYARFSLVFKRLSVVWASLPIVMAWLKAADINCWLIQGTNVQMFLWCRARASIASQQDQHTNIYEYYFSQTSALTRLKRNTQPTLEAKDSETLKPSRGLTPWLLQSPNKQIDTECPCVCKYRDKGFEHGSPRLAMCIMQGSCDVTGSSEWHECTIPLLWAFVEVVVSTKGSGEACAEPQQFASQSLECFPTLRCAFHKVSQGHVAESEFVYLSSGSKPSVARGPHPPTHSLSLERNSA